jgi:hypothetical protein
VVLAEPAGDLAQLALQHDLRLARRGRAPHDARVGTMAQFALEAALHLCAGAAVRAADPQRAEIEPAQHLERRRVPHAEQLARVVRSDLLVEHVQQDVLGEVTLHEDPQRAPAQLAQHRRCDLLGTRCDKRGREPARVRPATLRGELRDRLHVVAQPCPQLVAVGAQQRVQARLVERDPVHVDPHVRRQPVRRRAGRRVGVRGPAGRRRRQVRVARGVRRARG